MTVWATSLRSSLPLAGIRIRLFSNKNQPIGQAISDENGLASIPLDHSVAGEHPAVILADSQPDSTLPAPETQPDQAAVIVPGSADRTGHPIGSPVSARALCHAGSG